MQLNDEEIKLLQGVIGKDALACLMDKGIGGYVERDYSGLKTAQLQQVMRGLMVAITMAMSDIQVLAKRNADIARELGNRAEAKIKDEVERQVKVQRDAAKLTRPTRAESADITVLILKLSKQGRTHQAIAEELNRRGIKTNQGKSVWTKDTVAGRIARSGNAACINYVVNDEEMDRTMALIRKLRSQGCTWPNVATDLNERDLTTRYGLKWNADNAQSFVYQRLKNK